MAMSIRQQLQLAAKAGDVEMVRDRVSKLAPSERDEIQNVINVAMDKNQVEVVRLLAPLCPKGRVALKFAVRLDKVECVKILMADVPLLNVIAMTFAENSVKTLEFLLENPEQSLVQETFALSLDHHLDPKMYEIILSKLEYVEAPAINKIHPSMLGLHNCRIPRLMRAQTTGTIFYSQFPSLHPTMTRGYVSHLANLYRHSIDCEKCRNLTRDLVLTAPFYGREGDLLFRIAVEAMDPLIAKLAYTRGSQADVTGILTTMSVPAVAWVLETLQPKFDHQLLLKFAVDRNHGALIRILLPYVSSSELQAVINTTAPERDLLQLLLEHCMDLKYATSTALRRKLEPFGTDTFKCLINAVPNWCLNQAIQLNRIDLVEAVLPHIQNLDVAILLHVTHPPIRELLSTRINQYDPSTLTDAAWKNQIDIVTKLLPHITIDHANDVILTMMERQRINDAFKILWKWKDAQLRICPRCAST